jgi:hypothetical protein
LKGKLVTPPDFLRWVVMDLDGLELLGR